MCLTMNFAKFPGTLLFTRQLWLVLLKVALKHLYVLFIMEVRTYEQFVLKFVQ